MKATGDCATIRDVKNHIMMMFWHKPLFRPSLQNYLKQPENSILSNFLYLLIK